jgi:hypothetical protein
VIARTIGFVALLLPSLALAETDFWISNDKININFGTFITEYDAEGRATSDAGPRRLAVGGATRYQLSNFSATFGAI